jgi:hypothetical protein
MTPIQLGDLKLYAVKELSQTLAVTIPTSREYIKYGKLRGRKIAGKYHPNHLFKLRVSTPGQVGCRQAL